MNVNLCTYFDKNYLSKFLTCRSSVRRYEENVTFYCLCLDDFSYNYIKDLNARDIVVISLNEVEAEYLELKYAKQNRDTVEFYFTLSPFLPRYILKKFDLEIINYIDSDLYFFDTPRKIINYLGDNSIILIEHGIKTQRFGKYNVGWLTFKNDNISIYCLDKWSQDCVNWCYDYVENGKYADQKYLDQWPKEYKKITILPPEFNCAPWNLKNGNVKISKDEMYINQNKLIFYHFHGLNIYKNFFSTGFSIYNKKLKKSYVSFLYYKYINELEHFKNKLNIEETNIRQTLDLNNLYQSIISILKKLIRSFKLFFFIDLYKK